MLQARLFINGQWVESNRTFDVTNPANGELIANAHVANPVMLTQAADAASVAFDSWAAFPARKRSQYLTKIRDLMLKRKEEIGEVLSGEQGKPLAEAIGEIIYSAEFFGWFAEEAKRLGGEMLPPNREGQEIRIERVPVGVVLAITPWNFPAGMLARKLAPALAAGCTVIVKPASQTPLTAVKIFEVLEEAGLPAGVANLVFGPGGEIGEQLLKDSRIRKVTFTGSTEVGASIMSLASKQICNISLELGGHAPFIVLDDADLAKAVKGLLQIKLRNAGQTCVSPNRIFVQRQIYDTFLKELQDKISGYTLGPYTSKAQVGPLIDGKAVRRIQAQVDDALQNGAVLLCGGKQSDDPSLGGGNYYPPTLLADVTDKMDIFHEETFGPVVPVIPFQTDDEMIAMANDSRYGLAAYVYSENFKRVRQVVGRLDYGTISVNDIGLSDLAQAPVGGMKESGIGREGGRQGMEDFTEIKCTLMNYQ